MNKHTVSHLESDIYRIRSNNYKILNHMHKDIK